MRTHPAGLDTGLAGMLAGYAHAMNHSTLRTLYERPGPWGSVYVDASRDTEDARQLIALRWRGLHRKLLEAGADEATREAIATEVNATAQLPPGRIGLAVFAAGGEVVLSRPLPEPPAFEDAQWAPLPHVVPLLAALADKPPPDSVDWMRVTVDRTGADIEMDEGSQEVDGSETYPIHKSGQGGWSAPRYERATEMTWDRNAREVADTVTRLVDRHDPTVVILAGDVRARQLLVDRLPERVRSRAVESSGSRAAGASTKPLAEATESVAERLVHRQRRELQERFQAESGHGRTIQGLEDVVTAARSAAIDTLLLDPDRVAGEVWVDPANPMVVAVDEAALRAFNASTAVREPAGEALVAAAVTADAEVAIVGDGMDLADGIGAIVRFRT